MRSPRGGLRARLVAVGVLSLVVATALALTLAHAPGTSGPGRSASTAAGSGSERPASTRVDPARRFLDEYVDPDGRVVRRDQGGDTVSEGQAYAMLLAVAVDDVKTFDRVWGWTRQHLSRPDGLLSWTWRDGAVVDANSAADADVDAAHALVVAGQRFDRPDLRQAGLELGAAVLEHETQETDLGRVLLAGQWADTAPYRVNPSYSSPSGFAVLGTASGDPRWSELADGDRAVLHALLEKSPLPPDWAQVGRDGHVDAMPPPGGGEVSFGLDAQRIAVRYAASCRPQDRAVAERIGRSLSEIPAQVRGVYDLGGTARVPWQHPLSLVASAASAEAAGDPAAGQQLLDAARALDRRSTTYYGAAWTALGGRLLQDPASLGAACAEGPITQEAS